MKDLQTVIFLSLLQQAEWWSYTQDSHKEAKMRLNIWRAMTAKVLSIYKGILFRLYPHLEEPFYEQSERISKIFEIISSNPDKAEEALSLLMMHANGELEVKD